ncbi:MAG: 3'-5' exoribonuclease [Muribaculaceae bacterium]|nr:3'-5' exoribonuclease [Muribaculaceae bacterium]
MKNFIALDVETANYNPSSICSIGCVKVLDGEIVDDFYSLVHPEPDWYVRRFTAIHGLSDKDTWNAPTFDVVWRSLDIWRENLPIVAHNAVFDYGCCAAAARIYQLDTPPRFHCTLRAARKKISRFECPSKSLPYLCEYFGIPFNDHHNALADARGCAELAKILL